MSERPPYAIPPLAEILATPDTGLRYATTFAGGGGSSLGYRWAGYRCVWANEFVEAARASYSANFPDVPVDGRDIRLVKGAEVLEVAGLEVGELDLLDGSPPCQPFSTAGRRQKKWGVETQYSDANFQRADDLFFQYVRLVDELRPRAFVAENVAGFVKGVSKGYFKEVHAALSALGYAVEARVLDAQWLGVPQMRQRLILCGVRNDLGVKPAWPTPLPYRYSVRDALPWIDRAISDFKPEYTSKTMREGEPSPTVTCGGITSLDHAVSGRGYAVHETSGQFGCAGEMGDRPSAAILTISEHYGIAALGDGHPPGVDELDSRLIPVTANMWRKWTFGGIAPRRFTIVECKRLCGFPDDYRLIGTYAERWARLGNAVVPPMARAMGEMLRPILLAARGAAV